MVFIRDLSGNQINQFVTVTELFVHQTSPFAQRQMRTGRQVKNFQILSVPIEIGRVGQIGRQIENVSQGEDFSRFAQCFFMT